MQRVIDKLTHIGGWNRSDKSLVINKQDWNVGNASIGGYLEGVFNARVRLRLNAAMQLLAVELIALAPIQGQPV
jgi:hypothetical protein